MIQYHTQPHKPNLFGSFNLFICQLIHWQIIFALGSNQLLDCPYGPLHFPFEVHVQERPPVFFGGAGDDAAFLVDGVQGAHRPFLHICEFGHFKIFGQIPILWLNFGYFDYWLHDIFVFHFELLFN